MTINDALHALADELAADGVPDPLAQPLTLALVWHDLCRLAGEPLPPEVAALVAAPMPLPRPRPVGCRTVRGRS